VGSTTFYRNKLLDTSSLSAILKRRHGMKLVLNMHPHNPTVRLQRDYPNPKKFLLHQENPMAAVLDKLTAGQWPLANWPRFAASWARWCPGAFSVFSFRGILLLLQHFRRPEVLSNTVSSAHWKIQFWSWNSISGG